MANRFASKSPSTLLAVGELLWDEFPCGRMPGGAPANLAIHARAMGVDAILVSSVGSDPEGEEILAILDKYGLSRACINVIDGKKTGAARVVLVDRDQVDFEISPDAAWDGLRLGQAVADVAARADALYFGTLGQRSLSSRTTIRQLLDLIPKRAMCFFDANLRAPHYNREIVQTSLAKANVLKLNETELQVFAEWFGLGGSPAEQITALASAFRLDVVALTRGKRGSLMVAGTEVHEHPGIQIEVCDTVGAGDAFSAALITGLLQGLSPDRIIRLAGEVSAFVCSQAGATPRLPADMLRTWLGVEPAAKID